MDDIVIVYTNYLYFLGGMVVGMLVLFMAFCIFAWKAAQKKKGAR